MLFLQISPKCSVIIYSLILFQNPFDFLFSIGHKVQNVKTSPALFQKTYLDLFIILFIIVKIKILTSSLIHPVLMIFSITNRTLV